MIKADALQREIAAAEGLNVLPAPPDTMPKKSSSKGKTTRRVGSGVEVRPPRQIPQIGGDERTSSFDAIKAKWLADETDLWLLAACEIPKNIPSLPKQATNEEKRQQAHKRELAENEVHAAVIWEALRYLYFTNQLSPFWRCWLDEGEVIALRRFQHEKTADSFSPFDSLLCVFFMGGKFPELAFVELKAYDQKRLAVRVAEQGAVKPVRASYYDFSNLAEWAFQQMKACKPGDIFAHVWGPMMQRPTDSPNRSQIMLEIDWSRGIEDIEKGMVEAISAEWKKAHPTGRKARRESDDKFLKGLVVMRRRELHNLDWHVACSVPGYDHNPIYAPKNAESGPVGPTAARNAMKETQGRLEALLKKLEGDEKRLLNTEQAAWIESYEEVLRERFCRK